MEPKNQWVVRKRPAAKPSSSDYEKRMTEKDYSYEFGVTLGAARNNVHEQDADKILQEFIFMLGLKCDQRFKDAFNKYWPLRPQLSPPKTPSQTVVTIKP